MVLSIPPLQAGRRQTVKASLSTGLFDKGTYSRNSALRYSAAPYLQNSRRRRTFNLNLTNTKFTRKTDFTPTSSKVSQLHIPVQTETARQHFTLFGVQFEQPFDDACFISSSCVVSSDRSLFIGRDVQQRFSESITSSGVFATEVMRFPLRRSIRLDVINRFIQLLWYFFRTGSWSSLCDNSRAVRRYTFSLTM